MQQRLATLEGHVPYAAAVENRDGSRKRRRVDPAPVGDDPLVVRIAAEIAGCVANVGDRYVTHRREQPASELRSRGHELFTSGECEASSARCRSAGLTARHPRLSLSVDVHVESA